jgi:tRNA threonylcarbamoyladenosine biosynthesis protein TsaE
LAGSGVAGFGLARYKQSMVLARESAGEIAVSLASLADTQSFAVRLAPYARPGDVIALAGDLGAGKTAFARGFINALFVSHNMPEEDVPSPTFTLIQEYQLPDFTLYHIDLYRIESEAEIDELGLEDAFADGVSLIEWPDRLGSHMPASRLEINFRQGDPGEDQNARTLGISAFGDWAWRLEAGALNG